ncbi:MAG: O-antigen ligase family protein [Muribaculum sp.]|nr:O-antigen ligase family protein [Muribaculum sp.]
MPIESARKLSTVIATRLKTAVTTEHLMLTAVMLGSVFASYRGMFEPQIVPRRYFTLLAISVAVILISGKVLCGRKVEIDFRFTSALITALCTTESVYALCQWAGFIFPQGYQTVTGHFDNPAGLTACLCAGLPFVLSFWDKSMLRRIVTAVCATAIFVALVLSQSRTGIIVSTLVLGNFAMRQLGLTARHRLAALLAMVLIQIAIGYALKRGSADGRLLIWICSMEMIADSPWIGHGIGAFKRLYMDYQAAFFQNIPDSEYALLADNVLSPFNEYIHITLCFGFVGMVVLAAAVAYLVKSARKRPSPEKRTAISALCCIGGVSLFSYPFSYPFIWVVLGIILWTLLKDAQMLNCTAIRASLSAVLIVAGIFTIHLLHIRIDAERRWRQAYLSKDLAEYGRLMPEMGKTPFFLYNYAVALDTAGKKKESLDVARRCNGLMANYELELLLGDLYRDNLLYAESESHYQKASAMCPCRFVPLNQLYDLYLIAGDTAKAVSVARQVVGKPVKVKSRTVTQIRYKMRSALTEHHANPY